MKCNTRKKSKQNQGIQGTYTRETTNVPISGYLYSLQISDNKARRREKPVWRVDVCVAMPNVDMVKGEEKDV